MRSRHWQIADGLVALLRPGLFLQTALSWRLPACWESSSRGSLLQSLGRVSGSRTSPCWLRWCATGGQEPPGWACAKCCSSALRREASAGRRSCFPQQAPQRRSSRWGPWFGAAASPFPAQASVVPSHTSQHSCSSRPPLRRRQLSRCWRRRLCLQAFPSACSQALQPAPSSPGWKESVFRDGEDGGRAPWRHGSSAYHRALATCCWRAVQTR